MWRSLSEDKLYKMIEEAQWRMESPVEVFWHKVKVKPEKWRLPPWGDEGGGFWIVAVIGQQCIYYNDIEEGFNKSLFEQFGLLSEYRCSQSDLMSCITAIYQDFMAAINVVK